MVRISSRSVHVSILRSNCKQSIMSLSHFVGTTVAHVEKKHCCYCIEKLYDISNMNLFKYLWKFRWGFIYFDQFVYTVFENWNFIFYSIPENRKHYRPWLNAVLCDISFRSSILQGTCLGFLDLKGFNFICWWKCLSHFLSSGELLWSVFVRPSSVRNLFLWMTSSELLVQISNNLTWMFPMVPSFKIA